ncbi:hypothetical protein H0H81_003626 [Sphagnurus paluster]|uniref:Uncharacterized protein n=1 Tax=Sphagnurus paluster TaxID=117069 RepID=A0A9P7KHK7_9AGAR|nr:hypothetical protein H0H81_003626 [Sphagnurus paluster]
MSEFAAEVISVENSKPAPEAVSVQPPFRPRIHLLLRPHGNTFLIPAMTSLSRFISASLALAFFSALDPISASPTALHAAHRRLRLRRAPQAPQEIPLLTQVAAWPTLHSPGYDNGPNVKPIYELPSVAEVFKMVAAAESRAKSPTVAIAKSPVVAPAPPPPPPPPAPMIAAVVPTTTTPQPPAHTYRGPGLVVVPKPVVIAEPEADPPVLSAVSSGPQSTRPVAPQSTQESTQPPVAPPIPTKAGPQSANAPARKLIIMGGVIAGLAVLMFFVYVFFVAFRKKEEEPQTWTKINSPPPPSYVDPEKHDPSPAWMLLSKSSKSSKSLYSSEDGHSLSAESKARSFGAGSGTATGGSGALPPSESGVIDIRNSYPRSKFSVCSSEYPTTIASSTRSSGSPSDAPNRRCSSGLLPAYEFFCTPSESLDDNHHSRAHSAPVFGHDLHAEIPGVMVRSIEHRRSRSVSGLPYTVRTEQRESGSSTGTWRGSESPQDMTGWPSAV